VRHFVGISLIARSTIAFANADALSFAAAAMDPPRSARLFHREPNGKVWQHFNAGKVNLAYSKQGARLRCVI
jgi:uncharacterized protein YigE (DUF2233 family)